MQDIAAALARSIPAPAFERSTARKPFNQGTPFDARLLEFHSERLPECANSMLRILQEAVLLAARLSSAWSVGSLNLYRIS